MLSFSHVVDSTQWHLSRLSGPLSPCVPLLVLSCYLMSIPAIYILAHAVAKESKEFPGLQEVDFAVPGFPIYCVLILVERITIDAYLRGKGRDHPARKVLTEAAEFSIGDVWSCFASCLMYLMVELLVVRPLRLRNGPYFLLYSVSPLRLPEDSWVSEVVVLLGVDYGFYWFHRLAHQLSFLWPGHAYHHSGEHMTLAVSLRQGFGQALFRYDCNISESIYCACRWVPCLPLALLGVHPLQFLRQFSINLYYMFWLHTCTIRRLPPLLEWVFMTPSHHRLHHDRRLHKNFGGMLTVFDRLHGTFLEEPEEAIQQEVCAYGLATWPPPLLWVDNVLQVSLWPKLRGVAGPGMKTATKDRRRVKMPPSARTERIRLRDKPSTRTMEFGFFLLLSYSVYFVIGLGVANADYARRVKGAVCVLGGLVFQGRALNGWDGSVEKILCSTYLLVVVCLASCDGLISVYHATVTASLVVCRLFLGCLGLSDLTSAFNSSSYTVSIG